MIDHIGRPEYQLAEIKLESTWSSGRSIWCILSDKYIPVQHPCTVTLDIETRLVGNECFDIETSENKRHRIENDGKTFQGSQCIRLGSIFLTHDQVIE